MDIKPILENIVSDNLLHAKWLNTLSYMENAGAKKISASEHKEDVNLIILKHAAEEHRHAYYLKKQLDKLEEGQLCKTYRNEELLSPNHTKFYLNALDVAVCRYLKSVFKLSGYELKFAAYLFVTYAIEVRADDLYPIYQEVLTAATSKVTVKSIILEEEGHLEEMLNQLKSFSADWEQHAELIIKIEQQMFQDWISNLGSTVGLKPVQPSLV